ncbi:MAG TPA: hypothetical protein VJL59_08925 [Anaerolineales bacterium]|nr:hypothetical protein [Anaerolineales bacterium]
MSRASRPILFAIGILILASLACNAILGGGSLSTEEPGGGGGPAPTEEPVGGGGTIPTAPPPTEASDGGQTSSEFPLPDDATNVVEVTGTVNYQTGMSLEDVMTFYREAFGSQGYIERELLTVTSDTTFSFVFDGHASGKAIVVQGVDLGGSTNVSISLQDI